MFESDVKSADGTVAFRFGSLSVVTEVEQHPFDARTDATRSMDKGVQYVVENVMNALGDGLGRHSDRTYALGDVSEVTFECGDT